MDKEKKGVLIGPHAYINKIYSNGNAEYTGFSFITGREVWLNMHLDQRGLDAPADSHLISSVGEAASRSVVQPRGGGPPTSTHTCAHKHTHSFSWCLDNLLNCKNLDRAETFTAKVS